MKRPDTSVLVDDPTLRLVWEQLGRPPGCRVVGGHVRDRLLGRATRDLDLTLEGDADTAGPPVRRLADALGVRPHLLGTPPHRVWRVETPELEVELWPLGDLSPEADLLRRDFACNALAWKLPGGPLVDLTGGLDDIRGRRLRAISRANLADDPVRLLRAPRFLAQLPDFELDTRTAGWIRELAPRLADAPRERVGAELLALLHGRSPSRGLRVCLELGLFGPAAPPGARPDATWALANLAALDRLGGATGPSAERPTSAPDDRTRLAFLARAWGCPGDRELAPYAWPKTGREVAGRAARLLDETTETADAPAADRRELAWRAGDAFPALIALAAALEPDRPGWRRWRRQWRRNPAALIEPKPLLSGDEIADLTGLEPGPGLGEAVGELLRAQVRGEVRTRGGAMALLRQRR